MEETYHGGAEPRTGAESRTKMEHQPVVDHHYENWEQQHTSQLLGMWIFLATEVMFFGGMFLAYIVFRSIYPEAFAAAAQHQNVIAGSINTFVLILSSLMMVMAVRSAQIGRRWSLVFFMLVTAFLGTVFLGIKAFEYWEHWREGLAPGINYDLTRPGAAQEGLFFWLYFIMTGVHAVHMIIGIGLVLIVAFRGWRGSFLRERYTRVEQMGLYWHFVDLIWLYLFGLFYIIR